MTRQTVSICNCKGGVALNTTQAEALAELLEWATRQSPVSRARVRRIIQVLRGEAPAEAGGPA